MIAVNSVVLHAWDSHGGQAGPLALDASAAVLLVGIVVVAVVVYDAVHRYEV